MDNLQLSVALQSHGLYFKIHVQKQNGCKSFRLSEEDNLKNSYFCRKYGLPFAICKNIKY